MLGRQIVIGFGVAIMLPMLVYFGASSFIQPPRLQEIQALPPNMAPEERAAAQKERDVKQREQRDASNRYASSVAMISLAVATPVAAAAILIGCYLGAGLGTGLILGGVLTLLPCHLGYYSYIPDWGRFMSFLPAFLSLLFVGYKDSRPTKPS
jgi:hypothetical protein